MFRIGLLRVTHVDSGHSVRGSWGDTRALHLTMEDDVRIKMNMINVNDYLSLQAEAGDNTLLIKKVGRVFSGPTESMTKMHDLMSGQELFTTRCQEKRALRSGTYYYLVCEQHFDPSQ